jgi:hypothetical protein
MRTLGSATDASELPGELFVKVESFQQQADYFIGRQMHPTASSEFGGDSVEVRLQNVCPSGVEFAAAVALREHFDQCADVNTHVVSAPIDHREVVFVGEAEAEQKLFELFVAGSVGVVSVRGWEFHGKGPRGPVVGRES